MCAACNFQMRGMEDFLSLSPTMKLLDEMNLTESLNFSPCNRAPKTLLLGREGAELNSCGEVCSRAVSLQIT